MKKFLFVINAGSSSIKFAIYQLDASSQLSVDATGQIEGIGHQAGFRVMSAQGHVLVDRILSANEAGNHKAAMIAINAWILKYIAEGCLLAVGHRVVHGGEHFTTPVLIDEKVLNDLENLIRLAPLHQPHTVAIIRTLLETMPTLPQVACFDTAFHCTQPDVVQRFALPRHFFDEGVRRYGFHGLSYEYIASVLPTLDPKLPDSRTLVAHLGNGASLCAMRNGRSVATTMGFSPLDGLVMGTRCGSLDPGVILYLLDYHKMDAGALEHLLYQESGLLGVSGLSSDMRILLSSNTPHAKEAIDLFVYRISREIGSLVAALGGLDTLVFTGGMGENSAEIRAQICQHIAWLGLDIDSFSNEAAAQCISTPHAKVSTWIINTDENLMIARHTQQQITLHAYRADKNHDFR